MVDCRWYLPFRVFAQGLVACGEGRACAFTSEHPVAICHCANLLIWELCSSQITLAPIKKKASTTNAYYVSLLFFCAKFICSRDTVRPSRIFFAQQTFSPGAFFLEGLKTQMCFPSPINLTLGGTPDQFPEAFRGCTIAKWGTEKELRRVLVTLLAQTVPKETFAPPSMFEDYVLMRGFHCTRWRYLYIYIDTYRCICTYSKCMRGVSTPSASLF